MRRVILLALLLLCGPALAQTYAGHATVIDGDTLVVEGQRIRLFGIDAPERGQTCEWRSSDTLLTRGTPTTYECGRDATAVLFELTRLRAVGCVHKDTDKYGRVVATCSTDAGDLGAAMVRRGWAVDYTRYSHGAYRAEQDAAKAEALGIWSGRFTLPEEWRRSRR